MTRVGVNAYNTVGLYRHLCFFPHLAFGALRDGFPDVHRPAGERPTIVVAAPMQKHTAFIVGHDGRCTRY